MKMTKKFLIVAAVAALVMGLTGCPQTIGDIKWKGSALGSGDGTKTKTVNQKNESKEIIRGMDPFGVIKRAGATCVVQMFDQNTSKYDGVVGFATYVNKDQETGTYSFLVVGVTNKYGTIRTYASYYCNIDENNLNADNFGVPKASVTDHFIQDKTDPYEVVILDWASLSNANINDGNVRVAIDFTGKTDGTIDINWYAVPTMPSGGDQAAASYDFSKNGKLRSTVTATRDQLGTEANKTKNGWIYAYANIYAGQTLNGRWDLFNETMVQASSYADGEEDFVPVSVGDIIFN